MATAVEIVGDKSDRYRVEDSYSILPVLTGKTNAVENQPAVVHSSSVGFFAIRQGDWKLILGLGSGGFTLPKEIKPQAGEPKVQLYNLKDDPGETRNMAAVNPGKVSELTRLLETIKSLNSTH
jgi:arylsulfatase A-like enzyme